MPFRLTHIGHRVSIVRIIRNIINIVVASHNRFIWNLFGLIAAKEPIVETDALNVTHILRHPFVEEFVETVMLVLGDFWMDLKLGGKIFF